MELHNINHDCIKESLDLLKTGITDNSKVYRIASGYYRTRLNKWQLRVINGLIHITIVSAIYFMIK